MKAYLSIIVLILLTFSATQIFSQTEKEFAQFDKITYDYFIARKWDELIDKGKEALDKNIDFYYLRMRMGISYYEMKNYMLATPHFEKALKFVPRDTVAMEYLYYSYLFSGKKSDADILAEEFPMKLKYKIKYNYPQFFDGAYTEGGYTFNMDFKDQIHTDIIGGAKIYGEQTVFKNHRYFNISLLHNIGTRLKIFHGYSNLYLTSVHQFNDVIGGEKSFDVTTNQNEYYINANLNLGNGFNLTSAFHYLNIDEKDYTFSYSTDSLGFLKPDYKEKKYKSDESIFSLSANKTFSIFGISLFGTYSNLNKGKQVQNGFMFIFFPKGNLDLYFSTTATYVFSKNQFDSSYANHWVLKQKGGLKLFTPLWIEGSFTYGDMLNYNEDNAFVVYNNTELIKSRTEINLIYLISPKIELSLRYQSFLLEHNYLTYTNTTTYNWTKTNFINNTLIGGLKWTF